MHFADSSYAFAEQTDSAHIMLKKRLKKAFCLIKEICSLIITALTELRYLSVYGKSIL